MLVHVSKIKSSSLLPAHGHFWQPLSCQSIPFPFSSILMLLLVTSVEKSTRLLQLSVSNLKCLLLSKENISMVIIDILTARRKKKY